MFSSAYLFANSIKKKLLTYLTKYSMYTLHTRYDVNVSSRRHLVKWGAVNLYVLFLLIIKLTQQILYRKFWTLDETAFIRRKYVIFDYYYCFFFFFKFVQFKIYNAVIVGKFNTDSSVCIRTIFEMEKLTKCFQLTVFIFQLVLTLALKLLYLCYLKCTDGIKRTYSSYSSLIIHKLDEIRRIFCK